MLTNFLFLIFFLRYQGGTWDVAQSFCAQTGPEVLVGFREVHHSVMLARAIFPVAGGWAGGLRPEVFFFEKRRPEVPPLRL